MNNYAMSLRILALLAIIPMAAWAQPYPPGPRIDLETQRWFYVPREPGPPYPRRGLPYGPRYRFYPHYEHAIPGYPSYPGFPFIDCYRQPWRCGGPP
jgi:hypothetical protein